MSPIAAVLVSLGLAALLVAVVGPRRGRTAVFGLLARDKKGRLTLVLSPAKRNRKKKGRK